MLPRKHSYKQLSWKSPEVSAGFNIRFSFSLSTALAWPSAGPQSDM